MPSSFGQWLIVILALLVGLAGGWVLRGRQAAATAPQGPSIMGDDPVVGLSEEEKAMAAQATVDTPRAEATVDTTPAPVAVVDEATPRDLDLPPAAASLAASSTALPTDDGTATGTEPATTDTDRVDATATDTDLVASADAPHPGATDGEGILPAATHVDEPNLGSETDERDDRVAPVATADTAVEPATAHDAEAQPEDEADAQPVVPVAAGPADEVVEPVTAAPLIPAPRTAVEDAAPAAPADAIVPTVLSEVDAPAVGTVTGEDGPADDFRRIQGVGPKMATALQDAGIRTYRQLAELDEAALRDTIRAAGLRAAASLTTWPQQAKVLAGAAVEADRVLPVPTGDGDQA